jgi:3-dehydroquinate synthase
VTARQTPVEPAAALPETVSVKLGDRSYDVLIGSGLIANAAGLIQARLGKVRCVVVTDDNVAPRHLEPLESSLRSEKAHAGSVILPNGEGTKTFASLAKLCERLLEMGVERNDVVVALGGGVIGDLAGFAASITRRGVRVVQIPTTLLAQVDSSVGGKTGINTAQGKNLVGTFHQPSLVLADIDVLRSLPDRQFRAGYVEAAKYGLLGDAAFFAILEQQWRAVLGMERAALAHVLSTSIRGKAAIVARDETENGDRMLLNLGHTFGHALEAWAGYSERLLHGEAVAIGICLAFEFSEELGFIDQGAAARVRKHFMDAGLPTKIGDIGGERPDAAALVRIMGQDKKVRDGKLTLILVRDIGEAFVMRDASNEAVSRFVSARTK